MTENEDLYRRQKRELNVIRIFWILTGVVIVAFITFLIWYFKARF